MHTLHHVIARIWRHPFNRGRRLRSIGRFAWWQLTAPRNGGARRLRLIDDTWINAHRGEAAVTGCLYCGLYEYREMIFLLRVLQAGDQFVDIGANSGVYTLLAATAGASVEAFEPHPRAYRRLRANIELNRLSGVRAHRLGVSSANRQMAVTGDRDSENHLVEPAVAGSEPVEVVALDSFDLPAAASRFCKVDIEGHELELLAGAHRFLSVPQLQALVIEVGGLASATGERLQVVHETLSAAGLSLADYRPGDNRVSEIALEHCAAAATQNLLYVRDFAWTNDRLARRRSYLVQGRRL